MAEKPCAITTSGARVSALAPAGRYSQPAHQSLPEWNVMSVRSIVSVLIFALLWNVRRRARRRLGVVVGGAAGPVPVPVLGPVVVPPPGRSGPRIQSAIRPCVIRKNVVACDPAPGVQLVPPGPGRPVSRKTTRMYGPWGAADTNVAPHGSRG